MMAKFDGNQHTEKQAFNQRWDRELSELVQAVQEASSIPLEQLAAQPVCSMGLPMPMRPEQMSLLQQLESTIAGLQQQLTTSMERRREDTARFERGQIIAREAHREGIQAALNNKIEIIEKRHTAELDTASQAATVRHV